jgi:hypothetical protein
MAKKCAIAAKMNATERPQPLGIAASGCPDGGVNSG